MPLLVRALTPKVIVYQPVGGIRPVSELSGTGTQVIAQLSVHRLHVGIWFMVMNRQGFQGRSRPDFGHVTRFNNDSF